jgi:hypothetical protein
MKTLLLALVATFSITTMAAGNPTGDCSARLTERFAIDVDFSRCDFEVSKTCETIAVLDYMNRCDGDMACTEMGIMDDVVTLVKKRNGTIKIRKINMPDHITYEEGTSAARIVFEEFMMKSVNEVIENFIVRTKFKMIDGEVYAIRGFKKKKMTCR